MIIKVKGREEIVYNCDNFPKQLPIDFKTYRHHKYNYYNVACAFDIETTTIRCPRMDSCPLMQKGECVKEQCQDWIEPYAFMYHWQFCINDIVIFGRTWEEYIIFTDTIKEQLNLNNKNRLIVYVHNLPFEFSFMSNIFSWKEIFAVDQRKPIKAFDGGIEYRCSYKLSNMSLEKFCENTPGCFYQKLTGEYDYDKIRTPDTCLTPRELEYCYCDVRGLCECINYLLKEDTIASIPMTSTGYVRRDCRIATLKNPKNKRRIINEKLTAKQYFLLKDAFRGGDTHASYMFSGDILEDVKSKDISSSYPYVMMTEKFPAKFVKGNPDKLEDYLIKDLAILMVVDMKYVKYTGEDYIPYIPISKCNQIDTEEIVVDNGRILYVKEIEMTLTEIDYKIIRETYIADMKIKELYVAKKKMLPIELREKIKEYFYQKSTLKGMTEKAYEYAKSKNRLNGIFGMTVTDIIKDEWCYDIKEGWYLKNADAKKSLKRYYENQNSFLSYQWGVWVTAYARQNLRKGLKITKSDTLYVDTDSIKYINDHEDGFRAYNQKVLEKIKETDIKPMVIYNDRTYTMGTMDDDGSYEEFRTWGAKKYCYRVNGKYKTTVAGLGKEAGSSYINKKGVLAFCPGTVFYPSGRMTAVYGDDDVHTITVDGCTFTTAGYCALIPTTYRLTLTEEYDSLLDSRTNV